MKGQGLQDALGYGRSPKGDLAFSGILSRKTAGGKSLFPLEF